MQAGELSKQNGDLDAEIGDLQGSVARLEDRRRRLSRYSPATRSSYALMLLPYGPSQLFSTGSQIRDKQEEARRAACPRKRRRLSHQQAGSRTTSP